MVLPAAAAPGVGVDVACTAWAGGFAICGGTDGVEGADLPGAVGAEDAGVCCPGFAGPVVEPPAGVDPAEADTDALTEGVATLEGVETAEIEVLEAAGAVALPAAAKAVCVNVASLRPPRPVPRGLPRGRPR